MQFKYDESKWVYLAGIIDTEGSIGLSRVKGHRKWCGRFYVPYVLIMNTNKEFIDFLVTNYGGGYHAKARQNGWGRKEIWGWKVRANLMREILPKVKPYLIIKKRQADFVLQALDIISEDKHLTRECYKSKLLENMAKLEELWKECRKLNYRKGGERGVENPQALS